MSKDEKPESKPAEPTRLEYTGGTSGSIRTEDGTVLIAHVEPGDVLEPASAEHRTALLATGHFRPTRRAVTAKETA